MTRRRIIAMTSAAVIGLGLAAPALAAGPVMPPSIPDTPGNQFLYDLWFGPTPPGWEPQGTIVADSGFRPTPNGLPYPNYGGSLAQNALFFATPDDTLVPMDSATMRDLYGDGVCAGQVDSRGQCTLTPAAEYWSAYLLQAVDGAGHCVGFAITAAGLFNGDVSPDAIESPNLGLNSTLGRTTQSTIDRNWSTQFTAPKTTDLTPAGVVEQLMTELQHGAVPSAILIQWTTATGGVEGHGITPYAIYDRGNGLYDIAIYDNNYPFKERAIHVDTVANTWEYEVQINPGAAPLIASGDATTLSMQLQDVSGSLAVQDCPVCDGGRKTNLLVTAPIPAASYGDGGVELLLQDAQGGILPADRYSVIPPLDSNNPGLVSLPTIDIDPANGYRIVVDAENSAAAFPLSLSEFSSEGHKNVRVANFPQGASGVSEYDVNGTFGFGADVASTPRLERSFTVSSRSYTVVAAAGTAVAAGNDRFTKLVRDRGRVDLGDGDDVGGKMTVTVTLTLANGSRTYRTSGAVYPAGGNLVLVYKDWKTTSQKPTLWVDKDGDGTLDEQLKMKKVR
jgi:hypothetical protein